MGSAWTLLSGLLLIFLSGVSAAGAQEEGYPVQIYQYAVDHPLEDAQLPTLPAVGVSVPQAVAVATVENRPDVVFGYFYYEGRPVIVDLTTRSIVRVGN